MVFANSADNLKDKKFLINLYKQKKVHGVKTKFGKMLFDDFKIISKKCLIKIDSLIEKDTDYWGFRFYWHKFFRYFFFLSKNSKIKFQIIAIDNKKLDKKLKKYFNVDFLYKKLT